MNFPDFTCIQFIRNCCKWRTVPGYVGERESNLACKRYSSSTQLHCTMAFVEAFLWAGLYIALLPPWCLVLGTICLGLLIHFTFAAAFSRKAKALKKKLPPLAALSNQEVINAIRRGNIHHVEKELLAKHGNVYRLRSYGEKHGIFILSSPTHLRQMLEDDSLSEKLDSAQLALKSICCGATSIIVRKTHGEGWAQIRKAIAPSFSNTNLFKTLPQLQDKIAEFTEILDDHIARGVAVEDLPSWMSKLTIDLISSSMFHTNFDSLKDSGTGDNRGKVYIDNFPLCLKEFGVNTVGTVFRRFFVWTKSHREAVAGAKAIYAASLSILNSYNAQEAAQEETKGEAVDTSILGHVVRAPYPTVKERVADISILMFAGHDTTAFQISLIMVELTRHPGVVQRMQAEFDSVFGSAGPRRCNPQQLAQLDYLGRVIKEGMRLWPVVAGGSNRVLLRDLEVGEYTIPKGSRVHSSFFSSFRTPDLHRPDEFIPDRWEKGAPDEELLKELFIPFSTGKRSCIGQNLALLEIKLVLSTLYYNFGFELVSDTPVVDELFITLKPKNANFKVLRRQK